jgi:hypothetical protein
MTKAPPKSKELSPWERRPWPKNGDTNQEGLYAGVGRALSQWERYEAALSLLFSAFVARGESKAARRSYNAIRTFEGRLEMLKAASETFFTEWPDTNLSGKMSVIYKNSKLFSERRNDIAHGVVDYFINQPTNPEFAVSDLAYGLYPSYASFKSRDYSDVPAYCYSSVELDYFRVEFFNLSRPAMELASLIVKRVRKPSLRGIYQPL